LPNSKISRTTPETQDDSHWVPPSGVLGELVDAARRRSKPFTADIDLEAIARARTTVPKLSAALDRDTVAVIAEIKRSSPSKGAINPEMDSGRQASSYKAGGASAISVLTEPDRFGGSDADLAEVMGAVELPLLKKDFHVTESQIAHAGALGVSAALVIVRAMEPSQLSRLAAIARSIDLELVYEVRNERELEIAVANGARIIGVNNRNLETLEIDSDTVSRIVPLIPARCMAIAESGYATAGQVEEAASAGADAVLIGSSLSASSDPATAVRALSSVARRRRSM
jgi:indole-3-glycerol phosphate synthase